MRKLMTLVMVALGMSLLPGQVRATPESRAAVLFLLSNFERSGHWTSSRYMHF